VAQAAERLAQVDLTSNSGAAGAVVMIVSPEGATAGVLVDGLGHVLTNWHSVRSYDVLLVVFKQAGSTGPATATRSPARVVGHSKFSDLALLKVDALPSGIAAPVLVSKVEVDSGSPIHAISPGDDGQWHHSVATVDRIRRNSSWYSARRVLHRADVIRAQMTDPRDVAGAPLFNNKLELVGLGAMVRTDKGELIGVSAGTLRAFLAAPG
jgi:S1-C subfamily serine protease